MHHEPIVRSPLDPAFLASLADRFGAQLSTGEAILTQHGASETHFTTVLPDAVVFARQLPATLNGLIDQLSV